MRIAISTHTRHYVVAEEGGDHVLNANRDNAGPWEVFDLVQHDDGSVSFIAHRGFTVTRVEDDAGRLDATSICLDAPSRWFIEPLDEHHVAIKPARADETCWSATGGGGGALELKVPGTADRRPGPWETFRLWNLDAGDRPPVRSSLPPLEMPHGYRGDILTLNMKGSDPKAPYATFDWTKFSRQERDQARGFMRARDYNVVFFSCYSELDGHSWDATYRGGYNLLERPQRAIDLINENADHGFHSFLSLKSDDCPGMDGRKTDPWAGLAYMRKHLPRFLDTVRPHMTLPAVSTGTEVNEWATAESHGDFMQLISDAHPDLWIGQWYTASRDNHGKRTGSSYGPESFRWKGTTIDWAAPWWKMSQARCRGKAFLMLQATKVGGGESDDAYKRRFREQMHTLYLRSTGHKWGVTFPLWLFEVDWDRGEEWAVMLATIAAEEGLRSFGQAAPPLAT